MPGLFDDIVAEQPQNQSGLFDDIVAEKPKEPSKEPMAWGDVGTGAIKNIGPSAIQFAKDIAQPFIHPIDTAENLKNLGHGILQKTGILPGSEHEKYADAVGQFFAERYGGIENVKKTLATDPVGLASDLSLLFTGGGSLAARAPGILGKTGEIVGAAGRAIDPISAVAKTAEFGTKGAAGLIGHLGTHTGRESIETAARAGFEGGEAARVFRENMRGTAPMEDTVEAARVGLDNMRKTRGSLYRKEMAAIGADKTVLDFDKIDRAYLDVAGIKRFKGESLSPSTNKIRQDILDAIDHWRFLDPAEFHTAEGLDALKQKIGDLVYGTTEAGTPARVVGDQIYKAIKQTVVQQAPKYAKVMDAYETATREIREIERTLSLPGDHAATVDTSLRKLQSVLRDNVNTSFGRRRELAQYLIEAGSPYLMERLAGQALKSGYPRGLGRLAMNTMVEGLLLLAGAAHTGFGAAALVPAAAALPFMSPRLMGEAAYYTGRVAAPAKYVKVRPRTAFQLGRVTRAENEQSGEEALRALLARRP